MRNLASGFLVGFTAFTISCTANPLIERAIKLKENYGGKENAFGYHFNEGENSCILMFRKNRDDWSDFFRILEINLGEEKLTELRREKPYEDKFGLFPRSEMIKACHEIDRNPFNGNVDGVAVPEETKSTLNYAKYKQTFFDNKKHL